MVENMDGAYLMMCPDSSMTYAQRPPYMAKEDKTNIIALMRAHTKGIQVDISKYPA